MKFLDIVHRTEHALVDDEDFDKCQQYRWIRLPTRDDGRGGYVYTWLDRTKRRGQLMYLHHLILGRPPEGHVVDHINRNPLDNRRSNLRIVNHALNVINQRPHMSRTGVRGVQPFPKNRLHPWVARIKVKGKQYNLGYFATLEEAARAREDTELRFYGERSPIEDGHLWGDWFWNGCAHAVVR
jgi:HNH endonuclease